MQNVYFISGLGADQRVFETLDLSWCEPVFLPWLSPSPSESLSAYSQRMRAQIPEHNPIVVGISFGGMLLAEMLTKEPGIKAVILASVVNSKQLPFWFKIARWLPAYRLLPRAVLLPTGAPGRWLFGVHQPRARDLFRQILQQSDPVFVKWAIYAILHWRSILPLRSVPIQIHGTKDRLLPRKKISVDFTVEGAGHLLTLEHPEQLSLLLKKSCLPQTPQ